METKAKISSNLLVKKICLYSSTTECPKVWVGKYREYFYSVIFEISDKQMQFAELKNTPKQKKMIL